MAGFNGGTFITILEPYFSLPTSSEKELRYERSSWRCILNGLSAF